MKILIKDSTGDLIPISISEEETFRELNKRMEKDYGVRMDFANLNTEKRIDLDQNILTYLSENNYEQAALSSNDYAEDNEKGEKECIDNMQTEESDSVLFEEVVQIIPEGYHLVTLDSELQEDEFRGEMGDLRPEIDDREIENTEIKVALLSENFDSVHRSEQILFEPSNDTFLPEICRLCATRKNDVMSIFGSNETHKDIIEKIELCLPIVIKQTDNLPKEVCSSCLEKLELCHQFRKIVEEAEKQLLTLEGKMYEELNRTEKYSQTWEQFDGQNRAETLDENNDESRKHYDENASIIIPVELSNANTNEKNNTNDQTDSRICSKELGSSKTDAVKLISEERMSGRMSQSLKSSNMQLGKCGKENDVDNILFDKGGHRDETISGQNSDSKIIRCRICGEVFQSVKKCHVHSSVHALENYYPCSLCEKTFLNEKDCNEHSAEHAESKRFERRAASHVCDECGKKFVTQDRLQFHKIYHNPDTKPCYCTKCDKVMASESSLYQHMLTVHTQYKEYCCDICGKQFRAQAQLSAHQRKHKNERPFECKICKKRFYSNDILRRHKKLHLPDKPYQCDQCGKRFDRNNTLTKHLLRHQVEAGESMICQVCNICKEVFLDAVKARIHLEDCKKIGEQKSDDKILELNLKETYICEYCQRCYTDIEFMKNHRQCHKEPSPYICTVCDTAYATYNQATAHKAAHKKSSKLTSIKDELVIPKYFACEICDKRFLHFTNMNIHRRSCSSGKVWTCRYCGATFGNAAELARHKKGESDDKTWPCNACHNIFGSECALEIHRETHSALLTEKKNFSCLHCGKTFSQKAHLTIHVRSHTGERPYSCDLCDKAYKIKTERDNHRRTHSGEKPFKCLICEKTFANTARLREHTRFHSGKRPYSCSLCNQSFKKANARNVHMTIHTGEKPYRCDVCGTYFRRAGDMRKHKRTQHGLKLEVDKNEYGFEVDYKIPQMI